MSGNITLMGERSIFTRFAAAENKLLLIVSGNDSYITEYFISRDNRTLIIIFAYGTNYATGRYFRRN